MKFTRERKMEKVVHFVFNKKFLFLIGILEEYADKEDDRLEIEIMKILENVRVDQALRVLNYLMCVCCAHASFDIPGLEKDLKFVNDALGPDE